MSSNQEFANAIAYEYVDGTKYRKGKMGDVEVFVDEDGFVNVTKICSSVLKKKMAHWSENKNSKELMKAISTDIGIPTSDLSYVEKCRKYPQVSGTYMHPFVAVHVATWCSPKYGALVSRSMIQVHIEKAYEEKRALRLQVKEQEGTIVEKDCKIDKLQKKLDEMEKEMRDNHAQLMKGHETTHKYSKTQERLLRNANAKLDHTNKKLSKIRKNCVIRGDKRKPTTLAILKLYDDDQDEYYNYYAIKCNKRSLNNRVKECQKEFDESIVIHQIDDIPSANEFWNYVCTKYKDVVEKNYSFFDLNKKNYCEFIDILDAEFRRQMEDDI